MIMKDFKLSIVIDLNFLENHERVSSSSFGMVKNIFWIETLVFVIFIIIFFKYGKVLNCCLMDEISKVSILILLNSLIRIAVGSI